MEIKSDKFEFLETGVADQFNFSSRQGCDGFVEDSEVPHDAELCLQSHLSGEEKGVIGCLISPQVTATKESIELTESSGLRSDKDDRFEDQEMGKLEDCTTMLVQQLRMEDDEIGDLRGLRIPETKECDSKSVQQCASVDNCDNCSVIGQMIASSQECDANPPQSVHDENDVVLEKRGYISHVIKQVACSKECATLTPGHMMQNKDEDTMFDAQLLSKNEVCDVNGPQGLDNKSNEVVDRYPEQEKYFYYDPPLFEETGVWIPVSVPPMSESEHQEWSRGFLSNAGTFFEEDMGWGDLYVEDKELTMWDVVVEMLLVARGKVNAFASGDIPSITWMSGHIVEQAWKEISQTLTEVNNDKTQKLLQTDPPKWLPDSSASACMLCSVRFHPIMCTRHHCRFCGGIFCSECTKGRSLLPEKFRVGDPQRICDVCCVRLESVQPYLMNQVSRAAQLPTHDLTDLSTLRSWLNFPWGLSMEYEIYKATNTIRGYNQVGSLRHERSIPDAILRQAKGLAILTVMKVGVMVTYNIGTGLVIARREDGSWSPPSAVSSFGVGWGAQAGGEFTDYIIVLRSTEAVKTFSGDVHLSVGAGLSAAVGILGRTAEADVRAGTGGYAACYTYSCSKGAFVGCSLEGSILTTRVKENSRFYGRQSITASDILLGSLPKPPAAATLYRALADLYQKFKI
ncbi:Zinc finger, FYVE-type, endofin [Heracleum sosnowskyi]|uniref:Zinc finger, FYVE-type, endofin n=1 Tax=Heracleum sosnowskyi TaxID=360622 RepID=A0AAD8LWW5_9APIA|nr:Zinc finger, FYVE-type, endofin [Heracleum sosnowskyi]